MAGIRRRKTKSTREPKNEFRDKIMVPIIVGVVLAIVGGLLKVAFDYFEKPKTPASSVQIQTSGDKSPVVQDNHGSVSIDNSTSGNQKKENPENSRPSTEGRK